MVNANGFIVRLVNSKQRGFGRPSRTSQYPGDPDGGALPVTLRDSGLNSCDIEHIYGEFSLIFW
jgi:hypothetical protein